MEKKSHRVMRVEREVQIIVAQFLSSAYKGELPGLVTVSRVKMPADLRAARVAVSFLPATDDEAEAGLEALQSWAPEIQKFLNERLSLRYCPKLSFEIDRTTEKVLKIEKILHDLQQERQATC